MRIDRFLYLKEKTLWEKILLLPLTVLSWAYGGVVRARILLYFFGFLKTKKLSCPVISIGNITVGGTGKTPLVMALARRLKEKGISVAILSRGYKGTKTSASVVGNGQALFLSSEEAGDEPFLMAKNCGGIPVLIGKDRFETGQIALQQFGVQGLLLDDGYQHLPIRRNLNILLIDSQIGFGDRHLLPRGILREPLSQLRRADLLLFTKLEDPQAVLPVEKIIRQIHPSAPVFHSHYEPVGLISPGGEREALSSLKGKKVLALSGIANAGYFSFLLRKCEMSVEVELLFPDHYLYTAKDLSVLGEKSKRVDCIVTTEKDMVKLKNLDVDSLPVRALRIEVKIWEEKEFYQKIMESF